MRMPLVATFWRIWIVGFLLCLVPASVFAQTPVTPASKLGFDVTGPATLADVNAGSIKAYVDGSTTGVALTGFSCVVTPTATKYDCTASLPALTPGNHTLAITIVLVGAESPQSNQIAFAYVVISIGNLRIR